MNQVFPIQLNNYDNWLQENAQLILDDPESRENTEQHRVTYNDDIIFYTNVNDLPKDVVIIQNNETALYSIVPKTLLTQLLNGAGVNHFPIITPEKFYIIDSVGEDITSLYLTRKLRAQIQNMRYFVTNEPKLAFLQCELPNYAIWTKRMHYVESIVDKEEVVLYRAVSPFKTCILEENLIRLKLPGNPELLVRISQNANDDDEHDVSITYDIPKSSTVKGMLLKISLSLFPIPHFQFIFSEGTFNGIDFEDEEIPSYMLFHNETVTTNALCEAGKQWTTDRVAQLQLEKANKIQLQKK